MNILARAVHSVVLVLGLVVASSSEARGAHASYALALLGAFHLFLLWRTRHEGSWVGTLIYGALAASWFLPFLPGSGSAYPPTRFLVILGSAAHLAHGEWGTAIQKPWAAGLFVAAWMGLIAWRVHNLVDSLTYGYDLAHVQNLVANTLDGRFLWSDYTNGSILSHHLYLSLVLLAPLYAWIPHPLTLQMAQVVLMGVSTGLVASASSRKFGSGTALPVLLVFLCHPAFAGQALHEFDPGVIGLFGTSVALWGWARDSRWAFWIGVLTALGSKEHFAVAGVIAGFILVWMPAHRRTGLLLMAISVAVGAAFGAYAYTSEALFSLKSQLSLRFGDGPLEPVRLTASRVGYAIHLLAPTGGVALLGFIAFLPALPEPLLNVLSRFPMHSLSTHYHVLTLPFLAWATGAGLARLDAWRPSWTAGAARFAVGTAMLAAVFSQIGPIAQSLAFYDVIRSPRSEYEEWRTFIADLPEGDIAVKGSFRLLTLIADRRPVRPLVYADLSAEIAKRPLLILDGAEEPAPAGSTLIAEKGEVRVYRVPGS